MSILIDDWSLTQSKRGVHDDLLGHVQDGKRGLRADAEPLILLHALLDPSNLETFVGEVLDRLVVHDAESIPRWPPEKSKPRTTHQKREKGGGGRFQR